MKLIKRKDFLRAVDNSLKNMQSIVDAEFVDGDSDRSVDDLFIEKRRYLRAQRISAAWATLSRLRHWM